MSAIEEFGTVSEYQHYLRQRFHQDDPALQHLQTAARDAGLPAISIGPEQGKFLELMVTLTGARKILEIGALAGYSGTWMARALPPGGKLISLEVDPKHAQFTREQWTRLGLADRTEIRVGPAAELLPDLADEAPFDMVFIDADKQGYPAYLEWALAYSRPGTVILGDNVELGGRLLEPGAQASGYVRSMHRFLDRLAEDERLQATVVPYADGLAMAVVRE